jgi:hypothetical protein
VHVHQSGDEYRIGANSRIRLIASDAPSAWGLGGSHKRFRVIADELTNWKDDAMWIALASATGKTDDAQTLVFTNAGTGRGTSWQWRVRESARHEPWAHLFSAKGTIASWVGKQWIAQMRALLPPAAFARAIENVWAAESGDFVTAEQVRAIVDPDWKPVPLKAWSVNYTAGLDLGLRKDRSALAVVHVDDEQRVALDELQTWEGSAKRPVSIERVLDAVRDAKRRYGNLTVHADPWQFELAISQLRTSGVDVRPFTMSTKSVEQLSGAFYRLISERRLRLYPDVALENELLGLRVIQRPGGWRFDHGSGFSDRATALALAATKAECSGSGSSSMPALHAPPAGVLSRSGVIGDEAGRYFDPRPHPPQISEAAYQYFRSIVGR